MPNLYDMVAGAGQYGFDPLGDIHEGRKTRFANDAMRREDAARPLMGQALQGDTNALNSLAGIDPQGFMEVSGFQDKKADAERKRQEALSDRVASLLNWADTPEKWQQATQRIQANGIELEPAELDFNNRGAVLAEYQTIKEQQAQENAQRGFDIRDRSLDIQEQRLAQQGGDGRGNPPMGYKWNADGTQSFVEGGPADPNVKNAKNTRLSAMPAELASRIGLAKDFSRQYPGLRAKIEAGAFGEPDLTAGADNIAKRRDMGLRRGVQGEILREIKGGSEAVTRMLTGAGMNLAEAENEVRQYLPELTDTSATIISKLDMLHRRLEGMVTEASAGRVASGTTMGETIVDPEQPAVGEVEAPAEETGTIPTEAVEELLADPSAAAEFDEVFGAGAAAQILEQAAQ